MSYEGTEDISLLVEKNKELLNILIQKQRIDAEKDQDYEQMKINFNTMLSDTNAMKEDINIQKENLRQLISILRHIVETMHNDMKVTNDELDEELSEVLKKL